jgi:glucose-6-phosphate-specific signal transduction histidine kinase
MFNYIVILLGLVLTTCAVVHIQKKPPVVSRPSTKTKSWILLVIGLLLIFLGMALQFHLIDMPDKFYLIFVAIAGLVVIYLRYDHVSGADKIVSLIAGILLIVCSGSQYYFSLPSQSLKYGLTPRSQARELELMDEELGEELKQESRQQDQERRRRERLAKELAINERMKAQLDMSRLDRNRSNQADKRVQERMKRAGY